ncbi:RNA-directed DNA polymerase from mobile element jockey [Eumeta japonica]|uniref:RNA-directed DNA polymerase from mobile element jockey n=1 Tax=Eumeta variegata TaxID=151549 RepID=A0A4C1ZUM3_EUMVA|nr:RNA-directed DNA polymerase from mobile element jockey [Eumeta japonica]
MAMNGHCSLILVSIDLPPKKRLLWNDIETLLALGDAIILFGDFYIKNTDWRCDTTNINGRALATLVEDHELAIIAPLTPTHLPANIRYRPETLDLIILKGMVLNQISIETLYCLSLDDLPILLKLGSFTGTEQSIETKQLLTGRECQLRLRKLILLT